MTEKARIFNPRRHKLLRKHIPVAENLITLLLLCVLALIVVWVALQKTHYNPADRDLAVELLRDPQSPKLYSIPLKPWTEPGMPTAAQTLSLGPFPQSILDPGWQPASRLKEFNSNNLYEKINGEAEKFIRQGFKSLYYMVLKSGDDGSEIAMELYDQGDIRGSMGIFSEHLSADRDIEQKGQVVFFKTAAGVIGRKGRFFFRVAGDSASERIRHKSIQLIEAFAQLGGDGNGTPEEFRILNTGLAISPELITYQSKNVFQYDFVKDFWFGRLRQGDPERVFLHRTQSSEEAGQLLKQILAEQSYEYKIIEQSDRRAILWHEYLQNYFFIAHQGQFIYGIENVSDKNRIDVIQKQFMQELAGG